MSSPPAPLHSSHPPHLPPAPSLATAQSPPAPIDRTEEWFVPQRGPRAFRTAIGLLFLPYTGMVIAFTVLGAMLAPQVHWDRVVALIVIYALALGVGAHALDALGGTSKPWGAVFSVRALKFTAMVALLAAYAVGAWFMQRYALWLWPIAIAEGFFVLAYNLEWFEGRFHTDAWFAFSWGALPALAGYMLQTNRVSASALMLACATAALSLVEIKASRPYKGLKRRLAPTVFAPEAQRDGIADPATMMTLETILKSLSFATILLAVAAALARCEWGL